jgi:hypothetical protein
MVAAIKNVTKRIALQQILLMMSLKYIVAIGMVLQVDFFRNE